MPASSAIKSPPARNVRDVVLGEKLFPTWYASFYPTELVGSECAVLYVCPQCFRYSNEITPYLVHRKKCSMQGEEIPGRRIYERKPFAIYAVDGEEHPLLTQNLSLFAKLFLDNKSVFFDVASFNYYLLVQTASAVSLATAATPRRQIVGFFSKEKRSWDNNNLACILIFPPWQRQGLGKILMGASYALSRRDGRVGGPEKPLSELGRRGYLRFWEARVAKELLACRNKSSLTVEELATRCWMLPDDVLAALKQMGVLEARKKGDGVNVCKEKLREWMRLRAVPAEDPIDEDCFIDLNADWRGG